MTVGVVGRAPELAVIAEFVDTASRGVTALILRGEAGMGKTTLWSAAVEQARAAGFRVLAARADAAEVSMTYAVLTDLLAQLDESVLAALSAGQRTAVDRVLHDSDSDDAFDESVLGAALRTGIARLAADSPVILALDDVQWLDASTRAVLTFAVRRFSGPIGVLATVRAEAPAGDSTTWLQASRADGVHRIDLRPLSAAGISNLLVARAGRPLSRPTVRRIAEASGGNPFYALELARVTNDDPVIADMTLPGTLSEVIRWRLSAVDHDVRSLLLGAAAASHPSVELLAQIRGMSVDRAMDLVEKAESAALVEVVSTHVRFTHPLLAAGIYSEATPEQRRATHRALAERVDQPELRARHLALAATSADAETLAALDAAADAAMARGAPSAAAELVDLAIALGGETPHRTIHAAELLFRAGAIDHARSRLEPVTDTLPAGRLRSRALSLLGAICAYGNDFSHAVAVLRRAADEAADDDPELYLRSLLRLIPVTGVAGDLAESVELAREAVDCADALGSAALRSEALAMWVMVSFLHGDGVDEEAIATAVRLEDPRSDTHLTYRASAVQAAIWAWTGELGLARRRFDELAGYCEDRGAELPAMWVAEHLTLVDVWRGRYRDAALTAAGAAQRAQQIGGQHSAVIAASLLAVTAAYAGRVDDARRDARAAIDGAHACGGHYLAGRPTAALGFLEVSLGDHAAALDLLQPMLTSFDPARGIEIVVGAHLPDAIEALTALGRLDEADGLIGALERGGTQRHRVWMQAVGARGRAMWLAARGELADAEAAAVRALGHHASLPMPFERARTQLLLGQLQQRRRRRRSALDNLEEAAGVFETLGAALWVERSRAALARSAVGASGQPMLTPAERRIADLVVSGMTSREIAAQLFVSPKTVEASLTRIYRKLGIRSRAQLHSALRDDS